MNIFEANSPPPDDKCWRGRLVVHLRGYGEELEHRLDVGEPLNDLAVDEADEIQRQRELHQKSIDQYKIAERLLATHDRACRHHHADRRAGAVNQTLAKVKPCESDPSSDRRFLVTCHRTVEAVGLAPL